MVSRHAAVWAALAALAAASALAGTARGEGGVEFVEAELTGVDADASGEVTGEVFSTQPPGARGFNDRIEWVNSLKAGRELAGQTGRPALVLIHNTACGACGKLKDVFARSEQAEQIVELSRRFVMVNLQNEEEPKDEGFRPDGGYIPRLFFLDSAGRVQYDLRNRKGTQGYDYFYYRGEDVVREMQAALAKLGGAARTHGDEL